MKLLSALLVSTLLCAPLDALAVVELNKTPTRIGLRPSGLSSYFAVAEALTTSCAANVIWINMDSTKTGKIAYVTVLAAKVTGKKISYLEYTQDGFLNCWLVQVEMAQ